MSIQAKVAAIEIGEDEVRLAVVKTGGRRPKVIELHACPALYPSSGPAEMGSAAEGDGEARQQDRFDALVRATKRVVKQMRTRPSAFVLCAPSQHSLARLLTIPFRGERRVGAAVQFELEPYLAFPIEELVVDHLPVQRVEGETEVLTVGVRRAYLAEQLAVLEAAGVAAQGIGLDGVGLTALWQVLQRRAKGLNAVLHVRGDSTVFAVAYGKKLAYFRHLSVSATDVRENPISLVREIQNSVRAFLAGWRGEEEIAGLTVTGMELFDEERALLEDELRMPVRRQDLFERLSGARRAHKAALREYERLGQAQGLGGGPLEARMAAAGRSNYWTGAIGVAMGAAGGGIAFNFRKGDLAWPGAPRAVIGHVLFSSCLTLLALVGVAWHFHQGSGKYLDDADALQVRIEEVSSRVEEMRASGIGVSPELFSDPSLLDVLAELSDKMPDSKVRITDFEVARRGLPSGKWITVRGESKNKAVFDQVFADLKASPLFVIDEDSDYRMEGGQSTFTITAKRPGYMPEEQVEGY